LLFLFSFCAILLGDVKVRIPQESFPGTKRIFGNPSLFQGFQIFPEILGNLAEIELLYQEKDFG